VVYDKIKELAREKGVTIQQMERDLAIPERNACKWNVSMPRADTLMRVAEYFGVPIEYFLK